MREESLCGITSPYDYCSTFEFCALHLNKFELHFVACMCYTSCAPKMQHVCFLLDVCMFIYFLLLILFHKYIRNTYSLSTILVIW